MLKRYWIQGLWLLSVPLYLWAGRNPDEYASAVLGTHPSYPVGSILTCIAVTGLESLVLYAIIRPASYAQSWKRSGGAVLLFLPWFLVCAVLLMHQPAYVFAHFLWLLIVNLVLGVMCIFAVVSRVLGHTAQ